MAKFRLLHTACSNDETASVSHTLAMSSMWLKWQRAVWSLCKIDQITVHVITTIITVMYNKDNEYLLMYIEIQSTAPPADLLRKVNSVESWYIGHTRILTTSAMRLSSLDATFYLLETERDKWREAVAKCSMFSYRGNSFHKCQNGLTTEYDDGVTICEMLLAADRCNKLRTGWNGPHWERPITVVDCKSLMMMTMKCQETRTNFVKFIGVESEDVNRPSSCLRVISCTTFKDRPLNLPASRTSRHKAKICAI